MDAEQVLNKEQLDFLAQHQDVFDALWELAESDAFKAVFGEMDLGEMLRRYEATLNLDDERDPELVRRYEDFQNHQDDPDYLIEDDDFSKLEAKYRK